MSKKLITACLGALALAAFASAPQRHSSVKLHQRGRRGLPDRSHAQHAVHTGDRYVHHRCGSRSDL